MSPRCCYFSFTEGPADSPDAADLLAKSGASAHSSCVSVLRAAGQPLPASTFESTSAPTAKSSLRASPAHLLKCITAAFLRTDCDLHGGLLQSLCARILSPFSVFYLHLLHCTHPSSKFQVACSLLMSASSFFSSLHRRLRTVPYTVIRDVVDAHARNGVHHSCASFSILAFVLSCVLIISVWQHVGVRDHGVTIGSYDSSSSVTPVALFFTPFNSTMTYRGDVVKGGNSSGSSVLTFVFNAEQQVTISPDECNTSISTVFVPNGNTTDFLLNTMWLLSYTYYLKTTAAGNDLQCNHMWEFTETNPSLRYQFHIELHSLLSASDGFCPTWGHGRNSETVGLQVTSSGLAEWCQLSTVGLQQPLFVRSPNIAPLGPALDQYCWANNGFTVLIRESFVTNAIAACRSNYYKLLFANSYEHTASLLDALGVTFAVLSLAYTITKLVLATFNSHMEKKYGVITAEQADERIQIISGEENVEQDINNGMQAALLPRPGSQHGIVSCIVVIYTIVAIIVSSVVLWK
jgi:hypothetical protein